MGEKRRGGPGAAEATEAKDQEAENSNTIAVEFLQALRPNGPWMLLAFEPKDRKDNPALTTRTVRTAAEVDAFVQQFNGKRNIYYGVNPTRTPMDKKAAKTDIAAIEYALGDLDPNDDETSEAAKARYMEQLKTFEPTPTMGIDSGNGLQLLWRLQQRIELNDPVWVEEKDANGKPRKKLQYKEEDQKKITDVEARIKAVMLRLGSVAGTQNVDRILRLPGTTNLPTPSKKRKGRVPCPTKLIHFNGASYPLDAFPLSSDDEPPPKPRKRKPQGRSEILHSDTIRMVQQGATDEELRARLSADPHVQDQPDRERYIQRQIDRARQWVKDHPQGSYHAAIHQMNEKYALVLVGDKAAILEETGDDYRLLGITAFKTWFCNQSIRMINDNETTHLPLAETWLASKARRSYNSIVFAPHRDVMGAYNLWRGFPLKPTKGNCSKFLAHIRDNVCRGDPKLYGWVIAWMADIFQNPGRKIGTSLALRGKMGTGKTIVGKYLRTLLGLYYWLADHSDHVTGKFNAHHSRLLLLHCDEGFWAGEKVGLGRLRSMVTSDKLSIEFKGKDLIQVDSFMRLLVTGDDKWVVPAGLRERRFAVLDVGEDHIQDTKYFAAIDYEMTHGGAEALLYHFLYEVG
jgi:hypothetical protein